MSTPALERAIAAYERGAWPEAEQACGQVLAGNPDDVRALQILAGIRARSGDVRAAAPLLERARAADPGNVFVLNSLGGVYARSGMLGKAREALETALSIDGRFHWAMQNLGGVLLESGDWKGAARMFERALRQQPDFTDAIASLADVAMRERRIDDARRHARRALELSPGHVNATLVLARAALRDGDFAAAAAEVEPLLERPGLPPAARASAHTLHGEALEGLGRYPEAFAAFTAANDIERRTHAAQFATAESANSPATVARLMQFVQTADVAAWQPAPAPEARDPVFLVGFPRSGTTLLELVLASHPDVESLEEGETLAGAITPLVLAEGGLGRWSSLTAQELAALRADYWRRVETGLGHLPGRRVFVDKMPLYTILLPLICRLFPRAKVILALRDPRDVVLSCFRNRFAMNAAMYQFTALDTAARHYDAVMRLARVSRERLPLALHVVRYEDVVGSFEPTIAAMLDFLGLAWTGEVARFAQTAAGRRIQTPSAAQVSQELYDSAIGRWRRYERQLQPVLPLLEPWVKAFNYG